ncbi:MAG: patatin-like phospholipase family protein [Acidimicrobiales bacterium]
MLGPVLDVFRMRQYFNAITRARELVAGIRDDAGLLDDARRALVRLPTDRRRVVARHPFGRLAPLEMPALAGRSTAVVATGGSGALASLVGVARALEEAGVQPAMYSLCSGSALFGFPLAAGIPPAEVAAFTTGLRPEQYVDLDWRMLARLVPTGARGFAGLVKGERLEAAYAELLGDLRLGDLAVPAYAPVWSIEDNRLDYIGPKTHPDLPVARAVHMAVALPLFVEPVRLGGQWWCDGGIVDILPVRPVLEIEGGCDAAVVLNAFYPPDFAGEDARGWDEQRASILAVASQVRTCQQIELARRNLAALRAAMPVFCLEPVPYDKVRGVGFYRQFLNTSEWGAFMAAGRDEARRVLAASGDRVLLG